MGSKGDFTSLILGTLIILVPIVGGTLHLVRYFIGIFLLKREEKEGDKTKNLIKLLMILIMIVYGIILGSFFFWMIWICKNNVAQSTRILGLFISLPYLFALFTISYAIGPAIAFGNISFNKIIRQIFDKRK